MTALDSEYAFIEQCFDDLFPLCRSITGHGLEQSLLYFQKFMPLIIEKVSTGTQVFDWTVPPEWHFQRARLWDEQGNCICDTQINNLHVVNYSEPIDGYFSLAELQPHLHSLPRLPDAIPYVTSYYQRTWGFCLADNIRKQLSEGIYKVLIESSFSDDGGVPFAHCVLNGESEKEILLTSYLCHPSLANNELSGPLVLLLLYNRIKSWKKRRYTYRFLLNPETIGSLCFLHNYHAHLKSNMEAGLILTCLGGPSQTLRYKASRKESNKFNKITSAMTKYDALWRYEAFSPLHGSDERQYCSPGFNLPMGQVARSIYGQYAAYHNSLDTKEYMDINQLIQSADQLEALLSLAEVSGNPVNQAPYGEPQLGKRGLYPNMNSPNNRMFSTDNNKDNRWVLNAILTTLSMADGYTSATEIADKLNCKLVDLIPIMHHLEEHALIKFNVEPLI